MRVSAIVLLWMQETYGLRATRPRRSENSVQLRRFGVGVLLAPDRRCPAGAGTTGRPSRAFLPGEPDRGCRDHRRFTSSPPCCRRFSMSPGSNVLAGRCGIVFASGEALPESVARRCLERLSCRLHNLYGPTEAAVDATYWECRADDPPGPVPIGRPIANMRAYVLDRRAPAAARRRRGRAVSGGHRRRPRIPESARAHCRTISVLTRSTTAPEHASTAPATSPAGATMETSSSWGGSTLRSSCGGSASSSARSRRRSCRHPAIRQAVVLLREDRPGDRRLVAYLVAGDDGEPGDQELRDLSGPEPARLHGAVRIRAPRLVPAQFQRQARPQGPARARAGRDPDCDPATSRPAMRSKNCWRRSGKMCWAFRASASTTTSSGSAATHSWPPGRPPAQPSCSGSRSRHAPSSTTRRSPRLAERISAACVMAKTAAGRPPLAAITPAARRARCTSPSPSSGSGSWSSSKTGSPHTTCPPPSACAASWTSRRCVARSRRSSRGTSRCEQPFTRTMAGPSQRIHPPSRFRARRSTTSGTSTTDCASRYRAERSPARGRPAVRPGTRLAVAGDHSCGWPTTSTCCS